MLFVLLTSLFSTGIKAQDIITLRSGEDINAKVTLVSDNNIEYKKWDNQDGPTFRKKLSEVFSVKYQNGKKEVFNTQTQDKFTQPSTYINPSILGLMDCSKGNLYINGHELSDYEIYQYCGLQTLETYKSACGQRAAGKVLSTIGWIDFGVGLALSIFYAIEPRGNEDVLLIGLGSIIRSQILLPLGLSFRGIGNGRLNWLVGEYNSRPELSDNLNLSISPSLLCTNTPTSGRQYSLGAALTLSF